MGQRGEIYPRDRVEADQYAKIEVLTKSVSELTGAVSVLNKTNTDLVSLLKKALTYEFYTILILIAALVYGAIGKEGLYSVRQIVPVPNGAPVDLPHTDGVSVIPWNDDLRHYLNRLTEGPKVAA